MTSAAVMSRAAVFAVVAGVCAASAIAQPMEWVLRANSGPSPRRHVAMAYDSDRGVSVLFGGSTSSPDVANGETWEWNGNTWINRCVSCGPSPRWGHAMAYDSARRETVLFGGTVASGDTWVWDGTTWTQRNVTGPSTRRVHAMAYDSFRGVTVLFGGQSDSGFFGDTWEWNGNTWTLRCGNCGPSLRSQHVMTYDSVRRVVVLFGGFDQTIAYGDTWEWDGNSWTLRCASCGPSAAGAQVLSYDLDRRLSILCGDATWEWNGTAWAAGALNGPAPRDSAAMVFDTAHHVTMLFGGVDAGGALRAETWELRSSCTTATIIEQPLPTSTCPSGPAGFNVTATSAGAITYQWQYMGGVHNPTPASWTNLINGRNPPVGPIAINAAGVRTRLLVVDRDPTFWPDPPEDHIPYQFRCNVTSSCGTVTSNAAPLTITGVCVADTDDGSGNGTPDCGVTIDDLIYYLFIFELGDIHSDVDDGSGTGTLDGGVTIDDLLYFLQRFEAGC